MAKSRKHPLSEESMHEKEAQAHIMRRKQAVLLKKLTLSGNNVEDDWFEEEEEIQTFEPIRRKKPN